MSTPKAKYTSPADVSAAVQAIACTWFRGALWRVEDGERLDALRIVGPTEAVVVPAWEFCSEAEEAGRGLRGAILRSTMNASIRGPDEHREALLGRIYDDVRAWLRNAHGVTW